MGTNYTVNSEKEKVLWNNVKLLHVRKDSPNTIYYKNNYNEKYKCIDIRRIQRGRPKTIPDLIKAYQVPPKLTAQILKNLLELCSTYAIPSVHHSFFKSLQSSEDATVQSGADLSRFKLFVF